MSYSGELLQSQNFPVPLSLPPHGSALLLVKPSPDFSCCLLPPRKRRSVPLTAGWELVAPTAATYLPPLLLLLLLYCSYSASSTPAAAPAAAAAENAHSAGSLVCSVHDAQ